MKLLFTLWALLSSVGGFCQTGDFIVKKSGDTLWGEVKLKEKMFYVENNVAPVKAEDISWIKARKYKGHFVFPVHLLTYTDNISELQIDYVEKGEIDTVLVLDEIFTSPKINLYYATDDFKIPFYFYKTPADLKPIQLVIHYHLEGGLANYTNNRAKYRGDKSKLQIIEDKAYVNQLHAIMGDCKNITESMWELLSYRNYSLKQIAKKYNKCN